MAKPPETVMLSFASRKAFCIDFSRRNPSARYLQVCLDLTIKSTAAKCSYNPKQLGRLLRPSCVFSRRNWTLVPETQKPAWPWIAGSFFLWNRRPKAWCSGFRRNCWACRGSDDEFFKVAFLMRNVATSLKACAFHHFLSIMSFCNVCGDGGGIQFLLFFELGLLYLLFFRNRAGSCQGRKAL